MLCAFVLTTCASANYIADERGLVSVTDSVDDIDSYSGDYDRYVTYRIYDSSDKLLWFGQSNIDDSGNFGANLKIRGKSGTYTLVAKNRIFGERTYDIDYVFKIYIEFNDVKNSGSFETVNDFLISDGETFGFAVKAYNGLDESAKEEIVNKCIGAADITDMDSFDSFIKSLKVEETYLDTCTDAAEINDYITETYSSGEGLFFSTPEAKFFVSNMSAEERKSLISEIISRSGENKFDSFKLDVIKAFAGTREYFKDVELLITNEDNICSFSNSAKSAYESSDKNAALKQLQSAISGAANVSELDSLLLKAAKDNPRSSGGSSSGGSSSGGSSSGGGGTKIETSFEDKGYFDIKPPAPVDPSTIVSTERFADLAGYDWAKDSVYTLCDAGIVSGMTDSSFVPASNVTREQFAAMITKALRLTGAEATVDFADVAEGSWYYRAVAAALRAGIIKGQSKTAFGVGANISRQDAAVMLDRVIEYSGSELESTDNVTFADSDKIATYAAESVSKLANSGIIGGRDGNIFAPSDSMTRAEAAVMLCRFFKATGIVK